MDCRAQDLAERLYIELILYIAIVCRKKKEIFLEVSSINVKCFFFLFARAIMIQFFFWIFVYVLYQIWCKNVKYLNLIISMHEYLCTRIWKTKE